MPFRPLENLAMRRLNFLLFLGTFVSSVSCSVLTSDRYSDSYPSNRGVPYFLPVGKLHLQVFEGQVQESTTPTATPSSTASGQSDTPAATASPSGVASSTPGNFNPVAGLGTASGTTKKTKTYRLAFVGISYVPDPNLQFVLNYRPAATAEDDVKITIGKNGLLSKVAVTTEDKTGAIVLKLIEIGKEAAKIGAIFGEAGETLVYDTTFDPFDRAASSQVKRDLENFGFSYRLVRKSGGADIAKNVVTVHQIQSRVSGVAFRPVFAYDLILRHQGRNISMQTVLLPNEAEILTIPITRAAFVKKVTTVGFDDGLLTEVDINKPSEALAFMEIPLAIVKAIVAVPGELIQLKFDTTKGKTDLLTQQKNELEAEQALQKLREQIQSQATKPGNRTANEAASQQPLQQTP